MADIPHGTHQDQQPQRAAARHRRPPHEDQQPQHRARDSESQQQERGRVGTRGVRATPEERHGAEASVDSNHEERSGLRARTLADAVGAN